MSIIIVGGDKRQKFMYDYLVGKNVECAYVWDDSDVALLKNISRYDGVMLPVPISCDGEKIYCENKVLNLSVWQIINELNKGQYLIGGGIETRFIKAAEEMGATVFDILKDETIVNFNAVLTAQGALSLLLENTQQLIFSKRVLVTGFGKVSKALCSLLYDNRMDVYVCARNEKDLFTARTMGYKSIHLDDIESCIHHFDFVFGTVPSQIINEKTVRGMKKDAVYFELASSPYGAKTEHFNVYGRKRVLANALPGRFCAQSWAVKTAEYYKDLILKGE